MQGICVLAIVWAVEDKPNIHADYVYPDPEDYNLVTLYCRNISRDLLDDAKFLRHVPDQDCPVQLPGSPTNGEINITLTPEEEGYSSFSSDSVTSDEIGLAGEL